MVFIHAFGEELKVFHVDSRENFEIMQCYSLREKRQYLLLHYVEYEQVKCLLPYYFSLMDNEAFEDYKGCFIENGELYLAFYRGYGRSMEDLLREGSLSLEKRIRLGKRVLEKILLWKLPCGIAGQLLEAGRILVDGEEIAFDYAWEDAVEMEDDICLFAERMADLIEALFQREISYGAGTGLIELLEELRQGKRTTVLSIYEGYCSICEHLPDESVEEATPLVRLKRICLKYSEHIQQSAGEFLLFAGYITVLVLLIVGIQRQKEEKQKEKAQGVVYTEIGTLSIRKTGQK